MLQRFRTLFNLPSTIRSSISKGEYDLAVREYKKAKSIALPSHVNFSSIPSHILLHNVLPQCMGRNFDFWSEAALNFLSTVKSGVF